MFHTIIHFHSKLLINTHIPKTQQRFSLSHSTTETTPEPMKSYNEPITHNNASKRPKHKKKKSLVETFSYFIYNIIQYIHYTNNHHKNIENFPPFHGTKHSENKQKITDLTMPKQIKKSLSFSYGNGTKN